jgi:hypothetical protein
VSSSLPNSSAVVKWGTAALVVFKGGWPTILTILGGPFCGLYKGGRFLSFDSFADVPTQAIQSTPFNFSLDK